MIKEPTNPKQKTFVWVGGIHGVGKSTLAQSLARISMAAYMASGIIFPYTGKTLCPNKGFFEALQDLDFRRRLEHKVVEQIKGCFFTWGTLVWDGHYSIKLEQTYIPGFDEKSFLPLFDTKDFQLRANLYLMSARPEQIAARIYNDLRDRNKPHVSRKIGEIEEHCSYESEMFRKMGNFFGNHVPTTTEEIFLDEGQIDDKASHLRRQLL